MKFVETLILLATLIVVAVPVSSGTSLVIVSVQAKSESAKLDEYGDLIQEDERVRLNAFKEDLEKSGSARGYILVYGGRLDPPGRARRYASRAKNYLVSTEGLPSERIVTIDGGHRDSLTVELWSVPSGAQPPIPNPTVISREGHEDEAWEFDEYTYGYEFSWNSYEVAAVRLDGFAEWLRSHPNSKGYIIAYALNRDDRRGIQGDGFGKARRIGLGEKAYLTKTQRLNPAKLIAIDGGYSNERTVVLWIVPAGAPPPRVRRASSG
jgi:hypothetical protein